MGLMSIKAFIKWYFKGGTIEGNRKIGNYWDKDGNLILNWY